MCTLVHLGSKRQMVSIIPDPTGPLSPQYKVAATSKGQSHILFLLRLQGSYLYTYVPKSTVIQ